MVNDMFHEAGEDSDVEMIGGCLSDSSEDQPVMISKQISAVAKKKQAPPEEEKKAFSFYPI